MDPTATSSFGPTEVFITLLWLGTFGAWVYAIVGALQEGQDGHGVGRHAPIRPVRVHRRMPARCADLLWYAKKYDDTKQRLAWTRFRPTEPFPAAT